MFQNLIDKYIERNIREVNNQAINLYIEDIVPLRFIILFRDSLAMIARKSRRTPLRWITSAGHAIRKFSQRSSSSFFPLIGIILWLGIYGSSVSLNYTGEARFLGARRVLRTTPRGNIVTAPRGELRNTRLQFRTALSPGVPYNRAGSPGYKTETLVDRASWQCNAKQTDLRRTETSKSRCVATMAVMYSGARMYAYIRSANGIFEAVLFIRR